MPVLASRLFSAPLSQPVADICCQLGVAGGSPCGLEAVSLTGHVSLSFGITVLFVPAYQLLQECNGTWGERRIQDVLL